jgi:hypothetical protein
MHGRRQIVVSNSILNHTSRILDVGIIIVHFIYYYLVMEKVYKNKQEQYFTFVRMGNIPALLPNGTPLVSRFFSEMSKKRQF